MKIPLLDLKREYEFLKKDIDKAVCECFNSQQWILGPQVKEFERRAANYLGVNSVIGVNSGTDALILALRALALKIKGKEFFDKEDEIITTPFTFVATAEAIIRSGARAVFVDISPDTYNIAPEQVEKAVTKNTVGIIPVHLYGLSADMDRILKIARQNNLFVLEDTAQAFGAEYKGKKAGTIGDVAAFSFFPSKNLGGCGDGGAVVTNNQELAEFVEVLRNHGQRKKYNADFIGYNSRLDSIQAAILSTKLKHIDKFNDLRKKVADRYNKSFQNIKQIQLPQQGVDYKHVYHLYTLGVSSGRDSLLEYLNSKGIMARIYYPVLLHKMKAFRDCKTAGLLRNTEAALLKVLTLPLHSFLTEPEVEYVIKNIIEFFK